MKWFTSDWHLNDWDLMRYCNRPFTSLTEMNIHFIDSVNSCCKDGDELYILGDLSITSGLDELKKIFLNINKRVNKHLILGNHDNLKVNDYKELGFASISTSGIVDLHDNKNVVLIHDPAYCQQNKCYVCGHVHGLFETIYSVTTGCKVVNVSPEVCDYDLVDEDAIDKYLNDLKTLDY